MPGQADVIGLFSERSHNYPASNSPHLQPHSDPKRAAAPAWTWSPCRRKDGVQVGIEATVFMRFRGERIWTCSTLRRLVRHATLPTPAARLVSTPGRNDGFNTWLDNLFRPVLDYNLRREIGRFECANSSLRLPGEQRKGLDKRGCKGSPSRRCGRSPTGSAQPSPRSHEDDRPADL